MIHGLRSRFLVSHQKNIRRHLSSKPTEHNDGSILILITHLSAFPLITGCYQNVRPFSDDNDPVMGLSEKDMFCSLGGYI